MLEHPTPAGHEPFGAAGSDFPPARRRPSRARLAAEAGAIAAAATGGVLVRYGVGAGLGPLGAFAAIGRLVLGLTPVDGAWAKGAAVIVGVLVHLAVVGTWAALLAAVAGRWTGARLAGAALAVALLAWTVSATILPPVLRLGHGARAFPLQIVLLHVVLALSLAVGMRLAQVRLRATQ